MVNNTNPQKKKTTPISHLTRRTVEERKYWILRRLYVIEKIYLSKSVALSIFHFLRHTMTLSPEGGPRKGGGGGELESPTRIEFLPTELDVVCTKLRSWNEKHPGNLHCAKLISARAQRVQENEIGKMRQMAKEIVHEIIEKRGGRFLKISEKERNPDYCSLMAHKSCVDRVARALRTAYSNLTSPSSPNNKDRSQSPKKQHQRKRKLKALYPHEEHYEATQGNQQIHPHALKLISLVCNCSDYRVLDQPRLDFTVENEPEKERLMRLQVRFLGGFYYCYYRHHQSSPKF